MGASLVTVWSYIGCYSTTQPTSPRGCATGDSVSTLTTRLPDTRPRMTLCRTVEGVVATDVEARRLFMEAANCSSILPRRRLSPDHLTRPYCSN